MKVLAASILLFALLAQNCGRYLVMLDFELNRGYIAKTLCVNRAKPKSSCKGSCYLKKKLDKTDKEEGSSNTTNNKDRNEVLFFAEAKNSFNHYEVVFITKQKYSLPDTENIHSNITGSVFHPPKV